jgi:plastocyanin
MRSVRRFLPVLLVTIGLVAIGGISAGAAHAKGRVRLVTVPAEDRFAPFGVTIHAGDSVKWVNKDEDDHTVVSDDAFTTGGYRGVNRLLPTDGSIVLRFDHPGTFVYYCRFHAYLDSFNQPVAPGPEGGIETNGNFGTPMSGVITVLPDDN